MNYSSSDSKNKTIKHPAVIIQDSTLVKFKKSKSEIKSFDDLEKHLNDYKSTWQSIGIDWDYANDVILNFRKWSSTGFLKTADDKLILQVINDISTEGELRGMGFIYGKTAR